MLYRSKHWSVKEWDCFHRDRNEYAYDDAGGRLCTDDPKTANLFKILDMLRDWNPNWGVNNTQAGYKSGFRTKRVNQEVGGAEGSYHTKGCAADIQIFGIWSTGEALAETVRVAAEAWGLEDKIGLGIYNGWVHLDCRGYKARW